MAAEGRCMVEVAIVGRMAALRPTLVSAPVSPRAVSIFHRELPISSSKREYRAKIHLSAPGYSLTSFFPAESLSKYPLVSRPECNATNNTWC
jgi:hypothetical protein